MTNRFLNRLLWASIGLGLAYCSCLDRTEVIEPGFSRTVDPMRFYRGEVGAAEARAIAIDSSRDLSVEPTSRAALRNLALTSLVLADPRAIARLRMAERFSRRDATTELALLEHASSQGDFPAIIRHLDRLTSVHSETGRAILDGDMTIITGNPDGRKALASFANRPWFARFAARSIARSTGGDDIVDLILQSDMKLPEGQPDLLPGMLNQMLQTSRWDAATSLAVKLGRVEPAQLSAFGLSDVTVRQDLSPLVWTLSNNTVVATRWSEKSGLQFDLGVNNPATLLERQTALAPGIYRLDQRVGGLAGVTNLALTWHVSCLEGGEGTDFWRQPVPLQHDLVSYRSIVKVPANCAIQKWRLTAPSIDAQTGASFQIASLSLQRAE